LSPRAGDRPVSRPTPSSVARAPSCAVTSDFDHNRRMAFVDEVTAFVRGGKGGPGSASLLREPYKPRGGPDGGDGGPGGSVVFEVSEREHDLSHIADHPHLRAENGRPGAANNRTGASGPDLLVPVPDGTVVVERGEV